MRIIYDRDTKVICGVIKGKTDYLPVMGVNDNTDFIETPTELGGKELLGKKVVVDKAGGYYFEEQEKQKEEAIVVELDNLKFHKDVETYSKKAEELGATVEIDDINSRIKATIKADGKEVGDIFLIKWGCCHYIYQRGEVYNRSFYPHYIGFKKLIEYLKTKGVKVLDMGGFSKEKGINDFKLKFGIKKFIAY